MAAFPDTILHIQGPVLPHPGTNSSTSRDQYFLIRGPYFHIRDQYFHIRGPVLPHPGSSTFTSQTSTLTSGTSTFTSGPIFSSKKFFFWFYPGTSPACQEGMTDQKSCATLYEWAQLFIRLKIYVFGPSWVSFMRLFTAKKMSNIFLDHDCSAAFYLWWTVGVILCTGREWTYMDFSSSDEYCVGNFSICIKSWMVECRVINK